MKVERLIENECLEPFKKGHSFSISLYIDLLYTSLKSSKLDKRLGSPTEITSSTLQTLKYTLECRNLVVICRNLAYIIGGSKGNEVFQTLIVLTIYATLGRYMFVQTHLRKIQIGQYAVDLV